MTRAKDISKIVTDADLSGTLDVTGTVTAGGLDIQGDGTISGGSRLTISDIADENNDGIRLDDSTTARFNNLTQDSSGNFKIQHWTGSSWQNNLTVTTGGNVGIGTSSPAEKLDVRGTIQVGVDGTTAGVIRFMDSGSVTEEATISSDANGGLIFGGNSGPGELIFKTSSGTERVRIISGGNVGIGTSSPNRMLTLENGDIQIHDTGSGDPLLNFSVGGTQASPTQSWTFRIDNSDSDKFQLMDVTDSRIVLTADGSGKVGIGTSSPSAKLHIYKGSSGGSVNASTDDLVIESNTTAGINILTNSAAGGNGVIYFGDENDNNVGYVIYHHADNALLFGANAGERMRIDSSGKVGIGTSSPSDPLHVYLASGQRVARFEANNSTSSHIAFRASNTSLMPTVGVKDEVLYFSTGDAYERARILGPSTSHSGYFKISDDGTYRDSTGGFHEIRCSSNVQGAVVFGMHHASYVGGGVQVIAARAATGDTYKLFEGYSGNAADREFRVDSDGTVHADGAYSSSGGDYAEMFEWKDGNTSSEDRVGKTVVLDGNQIRLSTSDDAQAIIIGVVSAKPVILGDAQSEKWKDKYETDDYGRYVYEDYTQTEWTIETSDGAKETKTYQTDMIPSDVTVPSDAIVTSTEIDGETPLTRRKLNSSYDSSQTYIPREQRKEFSPIGLVGKLRVTVGQTVGDRWIKMREISDTVHEYLVR